MTARPIGTSERDRLESRPCPVCGATFNVKNANGLLVVDACEPLGNCEVTIWWPLESWNSYARERRVGRAAIGPIGDLLAEIDRQDIRHRITDTNILWCARKVVDAIRAGKEGAGEH